MIYTNELRVGNYLRTKIAENEYDNCIVELIHKNHFDCRNEYGTFIPNGTYEPIPLTEEIIDKIDWDGYNKFCINSSFEIDREGHLFYDRDYTGINFPYLHKLQNMYFLITKKELMINL